MCLRVGSGRHGGGSLHRRSQQELSDHPSAPTRCPCRGHRVRVSRTNGRQREQSGGIRLQRHLRPRRPSLQRRHSRERTLLSGNQNPSRYSPRRPGAPLYASCLGHPATLGEGVHSPDGPSCLPRAPRCSRLPQARAHPWGVGSDSVGRNNLTTCTAEDLTPSPTPGFRAVICAATSAAYNACWA